MKPSASESIELLRANSTSRLAAELARFATFRRATAISETRIGDTIVPVFTNEFWTSKQRAAHPLHEVSYRACFKPQLPRFFIERLTRPGDIVYDPFMGRGTTLLEAAHLGRRAYGPEPAAGGRGAMRCVAVPDGGGRGTMLVIHEPPYCL